jgi:hypothetical protein
MVVVLVVAAVMIAVCGGCDSQCGIDNTPSISSIAAGMAALLGFEADDAHSSRPFPVPVVT